MATYPKTGSILDSHTRTALSTQIILMVEGEPVGAVQSFQVSQDRDIKRILEVGTDGTLEVVPGAPAQFQVTIKRTAFDGLSLTEAFSRGFRNVQAQRIPFDIVVVDQYSGTDDDAVITTYQECWFKSIGFSYSADNFVIVEDATVIVGNIFTMRGGEAVIYSQGAGGGRQVSAQIDSVEALADSGVRRGALDYEGLLSAAFS